MTILDRPLTDVEMHAAGTSAPVFEPAEGLFHHNAWAPAAWLAAGASLPQVLTQWPAMVCLRLTLGGAHVGTNCEVLHLSGSCRASLDHCFILSDAGHT